MRMQSLFLIVMGLLLLSSCNTKITDRVDDVTKREVAVNKEACERGECPCATDMGNIAHGSKVTVYSQETAACNEGCGKYAEELTCDNGKFSKELDGKFFKCQTLDCPSCRLGTSLILSGETITAYRSANVGCRESCEDIKQQRTCVMGQLTGSDDYSQVTCSRKTCRCELPDDSGFVSLDGSIKLYSAERAECGTTCDANFSQNRVCQSQGTGDAEIFRFSGSDTYRFRACAEATNCYCTLPNNLGILAHGETRKVWSEPTAACGTSCDSKPNVNVRCNNGTFVDVANPNQIINFATATYSPYKYRCEAEACISCQVPGTNISVLHGEKHRFARTANVGCNEQCDFLERTCNNGTFSGDAAYSAPNCSRRACVCQVGGSPATVQVGSSFLFYSAARSACGQNCSSISQQRTCREVPGPNGTFNYQFDGPTNFSFADCGPATGCSCALPNNLGTIQDGRTVTLTSVNPVPCGTTCAEVPQMAMKCSNGVMVRASDGSPLNITPSFEYKHYCVQGGCAACSLPGYGTIPSGTTLNLYSKNTMGCADNPTLFTYEFKCENSILLRNGVRYNAAADPDRPAQWFTSYISNCPGCPLPGGGSVGEGASISMYKFSGTVINGCGRGCKVAERKCEGGVLSGDPTYNMLACDNNCFQEGGGAPPRLCLLRWQNSFVTPDAEIPVFSKRSVACNDSCTKYFKLSRCDMTTGGFKDVPFDFIYSTCTEDCP